jgi:hypothetical protein
MVGQGKGVEALLRGRLDEVGDAPESVQQGELGMDVEVGEVVRREGRREGRHEGSIVPAPAGARFAVVGNGDG